MTQPRHDWSPRPFNTHRALLVTTLVAVACLVGPSTAGAGAEVQTASQQPTKQPHPAKQTVLGLYLTAREAYDKWKAAPDKVTILDVRTLEEFMFVGHAEMAWSIPVAAQLYQWDDVKKQFPMQPLPDFVARVRKVARPDDTLLVMCRSGGRSAIAVNLLAAAGFTTVYNITDGMEGDAVTDPDSVFRGQRLVNGWKNSGLPWTYDVDPRRMVVPAEFSPGSDVVVPLGHDRQGCSEAVSQDCATFRR
jgi:rhodanese-related sulfurtransferase